MKKTIKAKSKNMKTEAERLRFLLKHGTATNMDKLKLEVLEAQGY